MFLDYLREAFLRKILKNLWVPFGRVVFVKAFVCDRVCTGKKGSRKIYISPFGVGLQRSGAFCFWIVGNGTLGVGFAF